jgi:oligoribonuclease NrnB/cAMP/cGMP phosphodiesterase (DHH superfamily)
MNGQKVYVLYHGNCYDGFGAALAAWIHFNNQAINAEYIPVLYGKEPPKMEKLSDVFIVDFSYPPAVLLEIAQDKNTVVVLDHHATAEKDLSFESWLAALGPMQTINLAKKDPTGWLQCKNIHLKFDMTKSGAVMAWEYWHPTLKVPKMFQYLQDRDLWKFKLPHSEAISTYMRTLPFDFGVWRHVMSEMDSEIGKREIVSAGVACLKLTRQMVDMMADHARMMLFDMRNDPPRIVPADFEPQEGQYLVPVSNATVFFSEVGNELLLRHPRAKFAAYYLDRKDGMRQWGLRSRDDFDCSAIAKAFGGGGHKQSSGFVEPIGA